MSDYSSTAPHAHLGHAFAAFAYMLHAAAHHLSQGWGKTTLGPQAPVGPDALRDIIDDAQRDGCCEWDLSVAGVTAFTALLPHYSGLSQASRHGMPWQEFYDLWGNWSLWGSKAAPLPPGIPVLGWFSSHVHPDLRVFNVYCLTDYSVAQHLNMAIATGSPEYLEETLRRLSDEVLRREAFCAKTRGDEPAEDWWITAIENAKGLRKGEG